MKLPSGYFENDNPYDDVVKAFNTSARSVNQNTFTLSELNSRTKCTPDDITESDA